MAGRAGEALAAMLPSSRASAPCARASRAGRDEGIRCASVCAAGFRSDRAVVAAQAPLSTLIATASRMAVTCPSAPPRGPRAACAARPARRGPERVRTRPSSASCGTPMCSSCSAGSRTAASISSSPIRRTRSRRTTWDEFESLDAYVDWCDRWLAEVARVLAPHGSAYVCGFSEILADVKARSAKRFAGCRWLVWYYRNKANLGRDWGRSHESILHLRGEDARIDVDAVRVPYNGHTTKYPARVQAVNSQYGARRAPRSLGAEPARRQAARRDRDPGDLQRHGREDAARDAEARGADREARSSRRARRASSSSIRSSARARPRWSPRGWAAHGSPATPTRATSGSRANGLRVACSDYCSFGSSTHLLEEVVGAVEQVHRPQHVAHVDVDRARRARR